MKSNNLRQKYCEYHQVIDEPRPEDMIDEPNPEVIDSCCCPCSKLLSPGTFVAFGPLQ